MPLGLILLHALRVCADTRSGRPEPWLALNGIDTVSATLQDLTALLAESGHLAPPGEPFPWPHEQALLEALGRVDHAPEEADRLLGFLPEKSRPAGLALLAELSRQLSASLSARLKQLPSMDEAASKALFH